MAVLFTKTQKGYSEIEHRGAGLSPAHAACLFSLMENALPMICARWSTPTT